MPSRTLAISYVGDASRVLAAQKQIDSGHTQMQGGVSKVSSLFQSSFGTAIPLSAAAAGVAVVGLAGKMITAAADEGEALNKVNVVFGQSADQVVAFSDTSAEAFGLSKAAALEAAGGFGSMLQTAGLLPAAAAEMSTSIVGLAGDMASFNNQDPSDMLERLRSGLAGEEALRQFGVLLSEARVKAEAYRSGIAEVGDELTDAQKVQARYNLIMADTAKQQGDFARTAESLPNRMRTLSASFTDLAADIGGLFLPAAEFAIGVLQTAAENIEIFVVAGLTLAALRFVPELLFQMALNLERIGLTRAAAALGSFSAAAGGVAAALGPVGAAIGGAVIAGTLLGDVFDGTGQSFDQLAETIETKLNAALAAGEISFEQYQAAVAEVNRDGQGLIVVSGELGVELASQQQKAKILEQQMNTLSASEVYARQQTEALTEAQREQRLATLALSDSFLGIFDSAAQLAEAQKTLNELERKGKEDTNAYEAAVLDALAAQIGMENAVISYGKELVDAGGKQRDVEQKIRDMARELGISEDQVGDLIREIRGYIDALSDIPSNIETSIGINYPPGFTPPAQLQHGGIVTRPTLALVGEAGPEAVIPLRQMGAAPIAGGGTNITVNVHVENLLGGSARELAALIRDQLVKLGVRNVTTGVA